MLRRRAHVAIAALASVVALAAGCSSGATSRTSPTVPLPASTAPSTSTPTTAAAVASAKALSPGRHVESFVVKGVKRTAVVVVPKASSTPAPVVFVFHGHGGTGANIERRFDIEGLWPQAVVVYPDGLVGHAGKTDPAGVKRGWQTTVGESGDRDLALYDAMLASLRSRLSVDGNRIYAMGHSNGSGFVSLLLNQRGSAIAATANLSSQPSARLLATDPVRSMFMAMGMTDPIVPYANQKKAIPLAEKKLGANPATAKVAGNLRSEAGRGHLELETYIYPGGHEPPAIVPRLVVDFFRRHTLASG
jgi:polyhydroxybutyrate depolymerase